MGKSPLISRAAIFTSALAAILMSTVTPALAADPVPVAVDQGPSWTSANRDEFYSLDQGSRIMPLRWIRALKLPNGSPFMADDLRRYGFLPNPASRDMLPIGFNAAGPPGGEMIGMTCAACHTRQIEVDGKAYRIDGGPALIDFQAFVSDLDEAAGRVVNDPAAFADFAGAVLGGTQLPAEESQLRWALGYWYQRYHILMRRSLPRNNPWGLGRLDAIGMIFNRLTGLDLGPPPTYLIESNIKRADAPVRYPFLWNVANQDRTQWTGFAPNSDDVFRLLRNIGQVLGVFAEFHPRRDLKAQPPFDFWAINSVNIDGLKKLEDQTARIGPPRWPWALDVSLIAEGQKIYLKECNACHKAEPERPPWETTIQDVNTDTRAMALLDRRVRSGVLEGADAFSGPIQKIHCAKEVLILSTIGTAFTKSTVHGFKAASPEVRRAFRNEKSCGENDGYEARVLHGIWAAAPYLHNGSVPTLADLLKPAAKRPPSFKVGPAYDIKAIGLADQQPLIGTTMTTTGCGDRRSGNSRCGHEYGTKLSDTHKRALLEYLKNL